MIINGACRSKRCCLALSFVDDSAVVPIKAGDAPFLSIKAGMNVTVKPVRKRPSLAFWAVIDPRCEFLGGPLAQRWSGESHRELIAHRAKRFCYRRLRGLEGDAVGLKKVPETSPPGTQQHLVTCSRRGQHNAALATCCYCVSIATKFVFRCWIWGGSSRSVLTYDQLVGTPFLCQNKFNLV